MPDDADLKQMIADILRAWGAGKLALAPLIRQRIERARDLLADDMELPADDAELLSGIWRKL